MYKQSVSYIGLDVAVWCHLPGIMRILHPVPLTIEREVPACMTNNMKVHTNQYITHYSRAYIGRNKAHNTLA